MLWDYMKTLIMLRLTLEPPCICQAVRAAGAQVSPFGRIVLVLRAPCRSTAEEDNDPPSGHKIAPVPRSRPESFCGGVAIGASAKRVNQPGALIWLVHEP